MEGTDPWEKVRNNFKKGYMANLVLWPAVQSVNFAWTPLEHRVLVVNVVSLGECADHSFCSSFTGEIEGLLMVMGYRMELCAECD